MADPNIRSIVTVRRPRWNEDSAIMSLTLDGIPDCSCIAKSRPIGTCGGVIQAKALWRTVNMDSADRLLEKPRLASYADTDEHAKRTVAIRSRGIHSPSRSDRLEF